ncbi:hypothetical protein ACWV26_15410 [Rummeliibacillus sp. JY-2-4R]
MKPTREENRDLFDRTYIGKPGCMAILILVVILYIIYDMYK